MWVCVWVWVWVCGGRGSSRSGAKEMMQPLSYLPPRPSLCRRRRRRARPAAALGRAACRGVGRPAAAAAVREPPSPQNRRSKEMTQPLSCRPACHLFGEGGGGGWRSSSSSSGQRPLLISLLAAVSLLVHCRFVLFHCLVVLCHCLSVLCHCLSVPYHGVRCLNSGGGWGGGQVTLVAQRQRHQRDDATPSHLPAVISLAWPSSQKRGRAQARDRRRDRRLAHTERTVQHDDSGP